ncbi:MAG: lamin tail domain-containing protein [Draconibacterium sp.]|nr:lamin tail domain-containing protein [Draconibacterium sp.]
MPFSIGYRLQQLIDEKLFADIKPPVYKNNGVEIIDEKIIISGEYNLTLENKNGIGTIAYTIDGSDPRAIGGAISSSAANGGNSKTITVKSGTRVMARIKNSTNWSPLHEIVFENSALFTDLKVTELHYHPVDQDTVGAKQLEFIELKNTGTSTLDLSGLSFTDGIEYTFPAGTTVAPKGFVVVASNPEEFQRLYGFTTDFGYSGSLSNGGELIELETSTNETVISFTFYDTIPWPTEPDGDGYSLIAAQTNPTGDPNMVEYWAVSKYLNGSPMADDEASVITNTPVFATKSFNLEVYPNPTSSSVNIDFLLEGDEKIEIGLYDINGRLLSTLVNEFLTEGYHNQTVQLNNMNLKSGIYLVVFKSRDNLVTKKLIYQQ